MKWILYFFASLSLVGCHKPLAQPEDEDPIYRDLQTEYANAQKASEEKKKAFDEAKAALKHIIPQTGQTRKAYSDYYLKENDLLKAQQKENYYSVRLGSRKYEARQQYVRAFDAGKPWPDPNEYSEYSKEKGMQSASRNWRDRVPAYDPLKTYKEERAKKEKPSHGEHH